MTPSRPAVTATAASSRPTASSGAGAGGTCSIKTNAGNCYKPGEFCRKGDVGRSTTDAHGQPITCTRDDAGSQPHWH
ncbi:hypothetical protein GCM10010495_80090 [Kitasatospora herbaricolor]|nr:hypothetical protein GCM10010495_80090 [Kitasatospora herbaricolor]